jgi:hypothetical protein
MSTSTGFEDKIVPAETTVALSHITNNDPRPHYAHQSNLTEDRILYPVLNSVLDRYKTLFAANTPTVNLRLAEIGAQLARDGAWKTALTNGTASGYIQDGKVTVTGPSTLDIPLTMPEGTKRTSLLGSAAFGTAYAGERSSYERVSSSLTGSSVVLTVPAS